MLTLNMDITLNKIVDYWLSYLNKIQGFCFNVFDMPNTAFELRLAKRLTARPWKWSLKFLFKWVICTWLSFRFIFAPLKQDENWRLQQNSNLDHQGRGQARWPLGRPPPQRLRPACLKGALNVRFERKLQCPKCSGHFTQLASEK